MWKKFLSFLLLITIFSTVVFSGCSKKTDNAEQAEKVEYEISGDSDEYEISVDGTTIKGDENSAEYESEDGDVNIEVDLEGSVDLPEGYPSDMVPIYPDGRVTLAGKESAGYIVAIDTEDSISDVFEYYSENIVLDMVMTEQSSAETAMIMGTSGGMTITLVVSKDIDNKDSTLISITISG